MCSANLMDPLDHGSQNFMWQRTTLVILGWLACRTCKNNVGPFYQSTFHPFPQGGRNICGSTAEEKVQYSGLYTEQ